jgi:hypothetical protein
MAVANVLITCHHPNTNQLNRAGFERPRMVQGRIEGLMSLDALRFYVASAVLAIAHIHKFDFAYR